jgi:DNA modification methylase
MVDIHKITPNPKNANQHTEEQIERLTKLIDYQGFRNPLIVSNRTGFLVVGHGRLEAAKKLNMDKLPVIYQDFKDEAQEYAYLVSDNEIARWASLDSDAVFKELENLDLTDIELLGIEDFEIPEIEELDPQTDEDEVPEVDNPITKRGDIWLLGKHRLMCGDSTMIDDVEKLMAGEKADMVFTDPPYGMKLNADFSSIETEKDGWKGKGGKYRDVIGDHDDFSEDLINTIFSFNYVKEMFIWGADYFAELIPSKNDGSWIVWEKTRNENGGEISWSLGSQFELCWSKSKHKRLICSKLWAGLYGTETQDVRKRIHPTQKPIEVCTWFFDKWCKDLKKCVDLYLGSGTTLIACEKHNKQCYGMELDEKYCDVIINRWQNYTGKKAVLESTNQTYEELKDERA